MKNTVKKILALVFAVVMVCSLAVPALAAEEETVAVSVTVIPYKTDAAEISTGVAVKVSKANVEEAIDAFNDKLNATQKAAYEVDIIGTTGLVKEVGGQKADEVDSANVFNTGYWAVALNGKLVSEDLGTVAIEEDDRIVVYWNDPTFDTKLVQVDDSLLNKGVLSFYYYDAEGNQKALKDAKVVLYDPATNGFEDKLTGENFFITDAEGQIWISPEYLDGDAKDGQDWIAISSVTIKELKEVEKKDGYTTREKDYYNANRTRNIEARDVKNVRFTDINDLYNTADATGDMTMVYVLVAAAAVITLAAVVVMKKKAVKAN